MTTTPQWAKDAADAVFGELADRSGFDHWWGNIGEDTSNEILDAVAASIAAAAPPHPAAVSGRARELVWKCLHSKYWRAKPFPGTSSAYYAAQTSDNTKIAAMAPDEHLGMFDDVDEAKATCEAHWQAYVRSLLAPVDEAEGCDCYAKGSFYYLAPDQVDQMVCAHGVKPTPRAATSEAPVANPYRDEALQHTEFLSGLFRQLRDYLDPRQPHPAPASGVAVVTEEMVDAALCAKFGSGPDGHDVREYTRPSMRKWIESALSAREGE